MKGMTPRKEGTQAVGRSFDKYERELLLNSMAAVVQDSPFVNMCACLVTKLCPTLFATLWTVALEAPLSIGFPRQEYWSGLPILPPGDLPCPGIELTCPVLAGRLFTAELPRKHRHPAPTSPQPDSGTCLCFSFCLECLPPPSLTTWVP